MIKRFELGEVLKDGVTGFKGVAMVRAEYYTGCVHYGLQSKELNKDGKPIDWEWIDSTRLVRVKSVKKTVFNKSPDNSSGPSCNGPQL